MLCCAMLCCAVYLAAAVVCVPNWFFSHSCRIFWAEHRGAFASIPGFTFEGDHTVSPQCSF
eukprot:COSAG06_NODE_19054_length_855_cov_2.828042_1_plen_60_part_10